MLTQLISIIANGGDLFDVLVEFCVLIFIALCCFPVHESAHAFMADKLGDPTGRLKGRISLNPLVHLDLYGAIMMLIFGFGYAKPVPVNIRNFKKRKLYFAITALAGPVSNLLLAIIFTFIQYIIYLIAIKQGNYESTVVTVAVQFFAYAVYINIGLAVFNLIPIPPLDGSRLLTALLPDKYYYKIMQYERYAMYALFIVMFILNRIGFSPVSIISGAICDGIQKLVYSILKIFIH